MRLKKIGFKIKIGSLLLLLYPFNAKNLLPWEKMFIRFENEVRWNYPFNGLGYYLLVIVEKK